MNWPVKIADGCAGAALPSWQSGVRPPDTAARCGIIARAMFIYAGIDEAGYGPMFGPLVIGRCVLTIPKLAPAADPPHLWQRLSKAVCRSLRDRRGRIPINDSKKLTTKAAGIKHLETGCLAFAGLADHQPAHVADWLDLLGETTHRNGRCLPWYAADDQTPWQPLPTAGTPGEIAIARSMLHHTCSRIGVGLGSLGAAVVYEDRFNQMFAATRSKASLSFTHVAGHLLHIWQAHGHDHPTVIVDRQGGRTTYRDLLALNFPDASLAVLEESPERSAYRLEAGGRAMTIRFMVEAEAAHMPVALASMLAKYTRELLMARFNAWFGARCPGLKPTAGYGTDAQRYWQDLRPHLPRLGIDEQQLRRQA